MIAFHGIWSAYGFWLPNDPRGSWSTFVANYELFRFGGAATKTAERQSVAHQPHDTKKRNDAKSKLKHSPVVFTGPQAKSIALGVADTAAGSGYTIRALAIMPDHVHIVADVHDRDPAQIMGHLKRGATNELIDTGQHPFADGEKIKRSCWADRAWKVFLDTPEDVVRAIRYVEQNPVRDGLRKQNWSCVTPLDPC